MGRGGGVGRGGWRTNLGCLLFPTLLGPSLTLCLYFSPVLFRPRSPLGGSSTEVDPFHALWPTGLEWTYESQVHAAHHRFELLLSLPLGLELGEMLYPTPDRAVTHLVQRSVLVREGSRTAVFEPEESVRHPRTTPAGPTCVFPPLFL